MTVDELISKLEEIKDKEGDEVRVFVRDDEGEFGELSDVSLEDNEVLLW